MLQNLASMLLNGEENDWKQDAFLACDRDILILKLHKIIVIICKSGILKLHGIDMNIDIVKKQVLSVRATE